VGLASPISFYGTVRSLGGEDSQFQYVITKYRLQ
jgi:hypothetical protein